MNVMESLVDDREKFIHVISGIRNDFLEIEEQIVNCICFDSLVAGGGYRFPEDVKK